ncbi:hypothetical protein GC177_07825 [bacterium]|nr:hypothetical protein [bacterium]
MTNQAQPITKKLLVVGDYGTQDLAFYEVVQKLHEHAAKAGIRLDIDIASVDSFDIAQTAVLVKEAAASGKYDTVYHNTAPRLDGKPKLGNVGEGLAHIEIEAANGKKVPVVGVASGSQESGNSFSLLRQGWQAALLHTIEFDKGNTQFRSRDLFPQEVVRVLTGDRSRFRETVTVDPLPEAEEKRARFELAGKLDVLADSRPKHPGNAAQGYVTIVAPSALADKLLPRVREANPGAEIDFIPLKSTTPDDQRLESSFVATQLAANTDSKALPNRALFVVPTQAAFKQLSDSPASFFAELENGARIISPDAAALTLAARPAHHNGQSVIQTLSRLPWQAGLSFGPDFNLHVLNLQDLYQAIPALTESRIAYVDGYGNVKLAQFFEDIQRVGDIHVHLPSNGKLFEVPTTERESFATSLGQHNLSRGSSGWGERGLAELWVRYNHKSQDSAASKLGHPEPGEPIHLHGLKLDSALTQTALQAEDAQARVKA